MKRHATFRTLAALALMAAPAAASAKQVTDAYRFKMSLDVPRIYSNAQSLGYRKYQRQVIKGKMLITYDDEAGGLPSVTFKDLTNYRHKVGGGYVTYSVTLNEAVQMRVNVIGDNRKAEFNTPSVTFGVIAEPSYVWGAADEDNSLYLTLAGKGRTGKSGGARVIRKLTGKVAGAIGCGCSFYGHVSPTRVMGAYGATTTVDDVAAVSGTWRAVRIAKESRR